MKEKRRQTELAKFKKNKLKLDEVEESGIMGNNVTCTNMKLDLLKTF